MVLAHVEHRVHHFAAQKPEIAGVFVKAHVGHAVDEAVEGLLARAQHAALTALGLAGDDAVAVGVGQQKLQHRARDLRPLLQVGVDEAGILPARGLQARVDRGLLAEVAREAHDAHRVLPLPAELLELRERAVGAAVVDEDELERAGRAPEGRGRRVEERADVALLVVTGDDERQRHSSSAPSTV